MEQAQPTFGQTVRRWRKRLGMTQRQLAEACGVSRNYMVMIEKGTALPPSDRVVDALERALEIGRGQLAWVAHLERSAGDVRRVAAQSDPTVKRLLRAFVEGKIELSRDIDMSEWLSRHAADVAEFLSALKEAVAGGVSLEEALMRRPFEERQRIVGALADYARTGQPTPGASGSKVDRLRKAIAERERAGARPVGAIRRIPLLSQSAAGDPMGFTDGDLPTGVADEYVPVPPELTDPNAFALRLDGDSMAPHLRHGDIVIVEPNMPVAEGMKVVAKTTDGKVTCKRLKELSARIVLASENDRYEDQVYPAAGIQWIYPVVMSIRNELDR